MYIYIFFSGSACFSKLAPPGYLQSSVRFCGKFESFRKEFVWTKFKAVDGLCVNTHQNLKSQANCSVCSPAGFACTNTPSIYMLMLSKFIPLCLPSFGY